MIAFAPHPASHSTLLAPGYLGRLDGPDFWSRSMEKQTRCRVRGLDEPGKAHRVENALFTRNGIHEAHADADAGQVWVRYDAAKVPPQRLRGYLLDAGVEPV